jgi:hypothetical protein
MNQQDIDAMKKRLQFLQETAREKTKESREAAQRANQYEQKIRELENNQKTSESPVS